MFWTTEGIFSIVIGVSAGYLAVFIIFGVILEKTGVGNLFTDLSMGFAGKLSGGPAKVAVISSAMLGTINGAAMANVATTGSFTIPLMKRIGYSANFAGAVEAVASTGGQIMPPVMGAAAFIMAEFLKIPYLWVAVAAIIPAVLYLVGVYMQVHLRALKLGLSGLPVESLPNPWKILKKQGYLLLPVFVLVYLLVRGYSPSYAGLAAVVCSMMVGVVNKETRLSVKQLLKALEQGGQDLVPIATSSAVVGLIVGVVGLTNLGVMIGDNLMTIAGGSFLLSLIVVAVISMILGMGLPTSACYIISAVVAAPALIKLGVPELPAHFFVFYYACLSMVTPPVAMAALPAAAISGGDYTSIGWAAAKLAIAGFIVPFMFVYSPVLLLQSGTFVGIAMAAFTGVIGVCAVSVAIEGYLFKPANWYERILFLTGGLLLIHPGFWTDMLGLIVVAGGLIVHRIRWLSRRSEVKD